MNGLASTAWRCPLWPSPRRSPNQLLALLPRFEILIISLALTTWVKQVAWRSLTFLQGLGSAGVGVLSTLHLLASLVLSAQTTGEARCVVCPRMRETLGGGPGCSLLRLLLRLEGQDWVLRRLRSLRQRRNFCLRRYPWTLGLKRVASGLAALARRSWSKLRSLKAGFAFGRVVEIATS